MDVSGLPASLSAVFNQPLSSSLKPPKVTPLPQAEVTPTSPSSASGSSTSSGPSVSAFSINVQLLQISIRQQSNGSTQVDVVKQQLKLFRAEVKSTVKDAVSGLDEDSKQAVDQLLKQFSRALRPRRGDDGDGDRNDGPRRTERPNIAAAPSSILANVQSALGGLISGLQEALQSDNLEQVVAKLQDLFKGLGDRLQPAPSTSPRDGETENQSAENPAGSSEGQGNNASSSVSFSLTALSVQASYQRVQSL